MQAAGIAQESAEIIKEGRRLGNLRIAADERLRVCTTSSLLRVEKSREADTDEMTFESSLFYQVTAQRAFAG